MTARLERHKRMLLVRVEVGMAIARMIGEALKARGSGRLAGELPLGLFCGLIGIQARVFRLVRLALILQDRLQDPQEYGGGNTGTRSRWRKGSRPKRHSHPAVVTKAGKLYPSVARRWLSDQINPGPSLWLDARCVSRYSAPTRPRTIIEPPWPGLIPECAAR